MPHKTPASATGSVSVTCAPTAFLAFISMRHFSQSQQSLTASEMRRQRLLSSLLIYYFSFICFRWVRVRVCVCWGHYILWATPAGINFTCGPIKTVQHYDYDYVKCVSGMYVCSRTQSYSLSPYLFPSLYVFLTLPFGKVLELEFDLKNCANFSLTALWDTIKIRSF